MKRHLYFSIFGLFLWAVSLVAQSGESPGVVADQAFSFSRFREQPVAKGFIAYQQIGGDITRRSFSETARLKGYAVAFGDRGVRGKMSYGIFFEATQGQYGPARGFVAYEELDALSSAVALFEGLSAPQQGYEDWETETFFRSSSGFSIAKIGSEKDSDVVIVVSGDVGRLGMATRFFEAPSKAAEVVNYNTRPVVVTFKAKDLNEIKQLILDGKSMIEGLKSKSTKYSEINWSLKSVVVANK